MANPQQILCVVMERVASSESPAENLIFFLVYISHYVFIITTIRIIILA